MAKKALRYQRDDFIAPTSQECVKADEQRAKSGVHA
jgi:hypothetical protein